MSRRSDLTLSSSLKSAPRQSFYEHNKSIAVLMILIVFLCPIIGVAVMGLPGSVLGLVISVFAYYFTPYATLKLREGFETSR